MISTRPRKPADPILLIEAALVLVFLGLFLALYFVPAGEGSLLPQWWAWPILAGIFFGILLLERWRRKRRDSASMSAALRLDMRADDDHR
jgi:hypothetical protein